MAAAAHKDDSRVARSALSGGLSQQGQEQVGQEEGPDLVGSKQPLDPLGRRLAALADDSGIVDEDVDLGSQLGDVLSYTANVLLRAQVKQDNLDRGVGVVVADGFDNLSEPGPCAGSQDEQSRGVGGKGFGSDAADPLWTDTGDQDCRNAMVSWW